AKQTKQVQIISQESDTILEKILEDLDRGCTIVESRGGYTNEKSHMRTMTLRLYIEKNKDSKEQKRFDLIFGLLFAGGIIGFVLVSPVIAFSVKYGLILMAFMVSLIVLALVLGKIRRRKILKKLLETPAEVDKRYLKQSDFDELFCQTSIAIFLFSVEPDDELLQWLYIRLKESGLLRSTKATMYISTAGMINERYDLKLLENKWIVSIPFTELYITEESVNELRFIGFRIIG
ncbi:MAG: hypothetical protein IJ336_07970, partial [Lachnospiraceae bacterium]|nr:hypothetical protein [Lachnospiraceae bacterium]